MQLFKAIFIILGLIAIFALFMPDQYESTKDSILGAIGFDSEPEPTIKPNIPVYEPSNKTTEVKDPVKVELDQSLKIANWNLQIFGMSKAEDLELLKEYAAIIDDYDIIFIQEIRDINEIAFPRLCVFLPDYDCEMSSRAGRTDSKEQYGIITKIGIDVVEIKDYNPDEKDRWERPPVEVTFNHNGYEFTAYNLHAKPSDVQKELSYLEDIALDEGRVMVLGDLNADCSYYSNIYETEFDSWYWLIEDHDRTNMARVSCAYDRIIVNGELYDDQIGYGVRTAGITEELSDHYLVWSQINTSVTV